jgi:hypothetical protein
MIIMLRCNIEQRAQSWSAPMLISLFTSFLKRRPAFRWQPSIQIRDGATAAALGIYTRD